MVQMACSNTLLQVLVDDDKRGRVMAFYAMAFMGMAPFGSLLSGSLAGLIGAPHTLLIGGILCILGALIFTKNILSVKNIMPTVDKETSLEIEKGIESSEEVADSL